MTAPHETQEVIARTRRRDEEKAARTEMVRQSRASTRAWAERNGLVRRCADGRLRLNPNGPGLAPLRILPRAVRERGR